MEILIGLSMSIRDHLSPCQRARLIQEESSTDDADTAISAAAREAAPGLRLADFAAFADEHARLGPDALHASAAPAMLSAHAALLTRRAPFFWW